MSDKPPPGPNLANLRGLRQMMGTFIRGMAERRTIGRGKISVPTKFCKVCAKAWHFVSVRATDETQMESGLCEDCQKTLESGATAFVCGKQIAWITNLPFEMQDMAGKVISVSPEVMRRIEEKSKANEKSDGAKP